MPGKRRVLTDPLARRGRASRDKGHSFERWVAERLRTALGDPEIKRGIGQARSGGEIPDVNGLAYWVECKRGQKINLGAALRQATEATMGSSGPYRPPVVVAKEDCVGAAALGDDRPAVVVCFFEDWLELVVAAHKRGGG